MDELKVGKFQIPKKWVLNISAPLKLRTFLVGLLLPFSVSFLFSC